MYKITTNDKQELVAIGKYGTEKIHIIHCSDNLEELKKEYANLYLAVEECWDIARVHLFADYSKDGVLHQLKDYYNKYDYINDLHLIGVFKACL